MERKEEIVGGWDQNENKEVTAKSLSTTFTHKRQEALWKNNMQKEFHTRYRIFLMNITKYSKHWRDKAWYICRSMIERKKDDATRFIGQNKAWYFCRSINDFDYMITSPKIDWQFLPTMVVSKKESQKRNSQNLQTEHHKWK